MKKKVADLLNEPNDPMPKPPKPKQRYDIDELLGPEPKGYRQRLAWYERTRKELDEEENSK